MKAIKRLLAEFLTLEAHVDVVFIRDAGRLSYLSAIVSREDKMLQ